MTILDFNFDICEYVTIAEFCETPILSDGFDLNEDEKIKLEKLSNILINISAKLDSIKQDIKSVENVQI